MQLQGAVLQGTRWENALMTTVTWADWVQLIGLFGGFALAFWQLRRTRKAADAARDAVQRTEAHLATNSILTLIPAILSLERDLDDAVTDGDCKAAIRGLARWRQLASELRGLLHADENRQQLVGLLQRSTALAASAKSSILRPNVDLAKATLACRKEFAEVSEALGVVSGELKNYVGGQRK